MHATKVLILRELEKRPGMTSAELAAMLRVTQKYTREVLKQLADMGLVGLVFRTDGRRWFPASEYQAAKERARKELDEARRHRKIMYLLEWREKKKAKPIQQGRAVSSVFQLGAQ